MVPEFLIRQWSDNAPWKTMEQVEQDLILCKSLTEIFKDEFLASNLAFRGGTALHKLFLYPQPRYSEDIDLVQIKAEPISNVLDRLRKVLSFLGKARMKQKANNNTMIFRVDSEVPPIISLRIKIETNCREHFSVLGYNQFKFDVDSDWYKDECIITTYQLEELLGTKLRALYQRNKGRDLFDLYKALSSSKLDCQKIIVCYKKYMEFVVDTPPSQKEFIMNMDLKMQDEFFLSDTNNLLRIGEKFDPAEAYELVKRELLEKL